MFDLAVRKGIYFFMCYLLPMTPEILALLLSTPSLVSAAQPHQILWRLYKFISVCACCAGIEGSMILGVTLPGTLTKNTIPIGTCFGDSCRTFEQVSPLKLTVRENDRC